jgi:uncharacterized protein
VNIIKTKERIRKGSEQSKRKEFIMVNIEQNLSKIQSLCKRFNVKQLFVFGSANSGDFTESSDIDFLVEFNRAGIKGSFDQYFGFKEALEHLLGREVDLICRRSIRNPIFLQEVESSKKEIYAK